MYFARHLSVLDNDTVPEGDITSKTSIPQEWNRPNRMHGIHARPVMGTVVFKARDDPSKGVTCTLYDACKKHSNEEEKVESIKG